MSLVVSFATGVFWAIARPANRRKKTQKKLFRKKVAALLNFK
jgi:hypothetical protein